MFSFQGLDMEDIIGHNCRFLIDSVPPELINEQMRHCTRGFCQAVKQNKEYKKPDGLNQPWLPAGRPVDELVVTQTNARKDFKIHALPNGDTVYIHHRVWA